MKKNRKNKNAPPPGLPPEEKPPVKEQPKKQPFLKRLLFGEETPDLSELEAGSTTILDILSPTSVDTKSRDYIVVDGIFHAYLYITGYGYSTTVGASWLAPLVEAGEGVSISFHFDKQSKEKILAKISQQTMMNRSRMRDVADTRQDFEELDSAIAMARQYRSRFKIVTLDGQVMNPGGSMTGGSVAKEAGFLVAGVYDPSAQADQEALRAVCDWYLPRLDDAAFLAQLG